MTKYFNRDKDFSAIVSLYTNLGRFKPAPNTTSRFFNFVLLCGKERAENDNRSIIEKYCNKHRKDIRAIYSEDLFKYINDFDLLSLEEILAEISSAIVLIVESFGSACELGAFAYNNSMVKKLFVINNISYIDDKSFINLGPIKKIKTLQSKHQEQVFFERFLNNPSGANQSVLDFSQKLMDGINKFIPDKRNLVKKWYEINLGEDSHTMTIISLDIFCVVLIDIVYFFGSINIKRIIEVICRAYKVNKIAFKFLSNNLIYDEQKVAEVIDLILGILIEFHVVTKNKNNHIRINYDNVTESGFLNYDLNTSVIRSEFRRGKEYFRIKSKAIIQSAKEGNYIWEK